MAVSTPWLNVTGLRRLPLVHQSTAAECGIACVAMIAGYHGAPIDLVALRRRAAASLKGATLAALARTFRDLGFNTRAVTCSVDELARLDTPCVLHWRFNHFVVLKRVGRNKLVIYDPARGVLRRSRQEARASFTGVALEISLTPGFCSGKQPRQLQLSDLVPRNAKLIGRFCTGLMLALVCECLLLASPLYLQAIIDGVLATGDELLLRALLLGFSALLVFQVFATALRALTFQYLAHVTVFDMAGRAFRQLLRLPLRYFRDRELGDVQHRFQALSRVQSFIVGTAPAMLLDAMFLGLLLVLMYLYDPRLTLLNVGAGLTWCCWRLGTTAWRVRLASEVSQAEASNQTHFLESLRAMPSVKAVNGENVRRTEWQSLFATTINSKIRAGNLAIADTAIRQVLLQGSRVLTLYLLARRGLEGAFSVGMIASFAAWLGMLGGRLSGLVDGVTAYRLLRVPLRRLADIVFAEPEPNPQPVDTGMLGDIELQDVEFRYAGTDRPVIDGCSARIRSGSFVAIAGPSGSGKSTLLQLIAGTATLRRGRLCYDGRARSVAGLRHRTATVFQDDCLLRGSIASNIAFCSERIDDIALRRAAQQACIADDIERLPMQYETLIGDLGSALSSGQVQRILLARAFYRDAELLLLDEATSGLNPELEKCVVRSLASLSCTRIIVTHSDRVLEAADEVLWLHEGSLQSSRPWQ